MNSRAQSILEYVVIIGVVSAALATMQLYLKRSVQSVVKVTADVMGSQGKGIIGGELDPRYERKSIDIANISTETSGFNSSTISQGGNTSYATNTAQKKSGVLQYEIWKDKQ
ncbi:MAG: hypothetical protein ABSB18_07855 [Candidatus Omnitrophota bacterium]